MDKAAGMNLENVRCLNLDLGDGDVLPGEYDLDPDHGLFHSDNTDLHHFGFDREAMMEFFRSAGLSDVRAATVAVMPKVGDDGVEREFSIFLVTGVKSIL